MTLNIGRGISIGSGIRAGNLPPIPQASFRSVPGPDLSSVLSSYNEGPVTWSGLAQMSQAKNLAQASAVTVSPAGLWVAVGYSANGQSYPVYSTSSDGITWTAPSAMNNSSAYATMNSVAVNAAGLFVAIGSNSSSRGVYAVSSDGTNWTTPTLLPGTATINSITVNRSTGLFVAVGYDAITQRPVYTTTTDGTNWTTPTAMNNTTRPVSMLSVTVSRSGLFVAVGSDLPGLARYSTSSDGISWTEPALMNNSTANFYPQAVAVSSTGFFVAVGLDANYNAIASTSTGGTTWTTPQTLFANRNTVLTSIAVDSSGLFIAAGFTAADSYPIYITSTDGVTWTPLSTINGGSDKVLLFSIAVNSSDLFAVVGYGIGPNNGGFAQAAYGKRDTVYVTIRNAFDGATYYWTINHISTSPSDFTNTSGSFTILQESGSFTIRPTADSLNEGTETFTISIRTGSITGPVLTTSSIISLADTSRFPLF